MTINSYKYVGPDFVKGLGYRMLLRFNFYDPFTKSQSIYLYFGLFKLKHYEFNSVYIPFYTAGVKHIVYKQDYLF